MFIFKRENCIICCSNDYDKRRKLKCGHKFHLKCINKWLLIKNQCPVCRMYINIIKNDDNHCFLSFLKIILLYYLHILIILNIFSWN